MGAQNQVLMRGRRDREVMPWRHVSNQPRIEACARVQGVRPYGCRSPHLDDPLPRPLRSRQQHHVLEMPRTSRPLEWFQQKLLQRSSVIDRSQKPAGEGLGHHGSDANALRPIDTVLPWKGMLPIKAVPLIRRPSLRLARGGRNKESFPRARNCPQRSPLRSLFSPDRVVWTRRK
jgi:hypothetical protein